MKVHFKALLSLLLVMLVSVGVLGLWSVLWTEKAQAAVYTVTLTTDTMPAGVPGELRWAITAANATPGVPDNINFAIPGAGVQTIRPIAALPAITDTVSIDGYTQPGAVPAGGGPAVILIELDGSLATMADGLTFQPPANGSIVRGLAINRFSQNGIYIQSANNVTVEGCHIGTDVVGGNALPNAQNGVYVFGGSTGCIIGGAAPASRNVISGNVQDGVRLVVSTVNTISGNYIGTDMIGGARVANGRDGVYVSSNSNTNTIGGTAAGQRNIISGNSFEGVNIDASTGNNVQGNYIGTNVGGITALANGTHGVYLATSVTGGNTIGGTTPQCRNVVSGNSQSGVYMNGNSNNFVQGNYIGVDVNGTAVLPNGVDGLVLASGSNNNIIGGGAGGLGNVISGNTQKGIQINNSTGNTVSGNYVGPNAAGTAALGNRQGVYLASGANSNTIGGINPSDRNLISGNAQEGIYIDASNSDNVQGNYIGPNVTGNTALPNGTYGVYILNGSSANTIGGATAGHRNVISGNNQYGVVINGSTGNIVQGNYVGTNATGTVAMPNSSGVELSNGATGNTIGGNTAAEGNLLSGNANHGAYIENSSGNLIEGNLVGTDAAGTGGLGNQQNGIWLSGANNNTIGGATPGQRNVISTNTWKGIRIDNGTGNTISGNYIGPNAAGTAALGNSNDGVYLSGGANNNTIGGASAGEQNVISGNSWRGIHIDASIGNLVMGNYVGLNAAGTAALGNSNDGVYLSGGANNNTIGGASAGGRNVISGNSWRGIRIDASTSNTIQGNYIGTNAAGTVTLGNANDGVYLSGGANNNTIGGAAAGQRNVISGNSWRGIRIDASTGNTVSANFIGTNTTGTAALGNARDGICLSDANTNTIGGTAAGYRNVISGNNNNGVYMANSTGNSVQGNYIGTDVNGTTALANGGEGIYLVTAANNNTIGGATAGHRNVISGNNLDGISIESSTGNNVQGNYIGTNTAGTVAVKNIYNGIYLLSGANGNSIGGSVSGQGNLISGNGGFGVYANGSSGSTFMGNYVGTNATGTAAVPNMSCGIFLNHGSSSTIGGDTAAERNLISGNNTDGVYVEETSGSTISGNYIGTNAAGTGPVANGRYGIFLNSNSGSSTIGGDTAAERNVISGNLNQGIWIRASTGSTISNDYIGTDVSGANALSNGGDGITFSDSADSNIVGGSAGDANLIASNGSDGVSITSSVDCEVSHNRIVSNAGIGMVVWDAASIRNEISENSICDNGQLDIDLMGDGVTPNDGNNNNPAKANRGYNFPVFSGPQVPLSGGNTFVSGTAPPNAEVELYFTGETPDPSGHGGGLTYKGSTTADASGNFTATLTGLVVGDYVSAIAISPAGDVSGEGNTSEFSLNTQVATGFGVGASVSGGHGTVTEASQGVFSGGTATIHITPDTGYHIASITDNGVPAAIANPYVVNNVNANHTIVVTFDADIPATHPWYLAEGCTEGDMETWILVQNPNATDVTVDLTFMTTNGPQKGPQDVTIAGNSRNSFNVGTYVTDWNVSTVVTPTGGNVICERAMYGPGKVWAHDSIGATETAAKWYLAEGSTDGGMETWVLVQNPGDTEVGVYISFQTDTGEVVPPELQDVKIPATSRRSFRVNDYVTTFNVSTRIDSPDGGVICERAVYGPGRVWAHESIGVTDPSTTWYLAEGSTEGGMETFVLVQNPTNNDAHVSVVFQTETGEVAPVELQGVTVPARSRRTFKANAFVTTYNVSTRVTSADQLIICERAMYGNDRDWAHDSIGVTSPADVWYLAEGCTEGGMETWVLVQNPGTVDVTVDLTFMTPTGEQAGPQDFKVQAGSRHTFKINEYLSNWNVSTKVESSGGNVICERAMYGNNRGWAHDSVGYAP